MTRESMVMQEPPAATMRARAVSVKRRAATVSLGTLRIRISSVTVPTTTAVRSVFLPRCLISLEIDTGGRAVREHTSLRRTVLQKAESLRLARKRKSCTVTEKGILP